MRTAGFPFTLTLCFIPVWSPAACRHPFSTKIFSRHYLQYVKRHDSVSCQVWGRSLYVKPLCASWETFILSNLNNGWTDQVLNRFDRLESYNKNVFIKLLKMFFYVFSVFLYPRLEILSCKIQNINFYISSFNSIFF